MANSNQPQVGQKPKSLRDYATPLVDCIHSSIRTPAIQANNFQIKPAIIQMIQTSVQFGGLPNDDPFEHVVNFLEICDTLKHNEVSDDAIRLRLFPFSLRDRAKSWLRSLPSCSITTWDDLAEKFLAKFFPAAKASKMRKDILSFVQYDSESLYETWERYKDLLHRCPPHGLPKWVQIETFYYGLVGPTRTIVDATAGGALMRKSVDEAYDLLEKMAFNEYQWSLERLIPKTTNHELDAISALSAQVTALSKKFDTLGVHAIQSPFLTCEVCGGNRSSDWCSINSELIQYVANYNRQQNNLNSNSYNPSGKNHPNFSWSNSQGPSSFSRPMHPPSFPSQEPPQEEKPSLEEVFAQYMEKTDTILQNLETQLSQLANAVNNKP